MSQAATRLMKQMIGAPVEGFYLSTANGEKVSLPMILSGKKGTVVVFWSGVCSHCMHYDRYLSTFSERHAQLGLVAIASRQGETLIQLQAAAMERKLTFHILHDPDGQVARSWSVWQTPRAFLIDGNCVLQYRGAIDNYKYPGDIEYTAHLEAAVTEFLSGKPLSRTEVASFGCAIESIYYNLPKVL